MSTALQHVCNDCQQMYDMLQRVRYSVKVYWEISAATSTRLMIPSTYPAPSMPGCCYLCMIRRGEIYHTRRVSRRVGKRTVPPLYAYRPERAGTTSLFPTLDSTSAALSTLRRSLPQLLPSTCLRVGEVMGLGRYIVEPSGKAEVPHPHLVFVRNGHYPPRERQVSA